VHSSWKGLGSYSTVGLEFALSVLLGLFGGRWLDEKAGAGGVLTFIGLVLGLAAGYRSVWRQLQRANRAADREEREDQERRRKYHDHPRPP
jgi:ATP synthase protein I